MLEAILYLFSFSVYFGDRRNVAVPAGAIPLARWFLFRVVAVFPALRVRFALEVLSSPNITQR
jgi:hypothetical protein